MLATVSACKPKLLFESESIQPLETYGTTQAPNAYISLKNTLRIFLAHKAVLLLIQFASYLVNSNQIETLNMKIQKGSKLYISSLGLIRPFIQLHPIYYKIQVVLQEGIDLSSSLENERLLIFQSYQQRIVFTNWSTRKEQTEIIFFARYASSSIAKPALPYLPATILSKNNPPYTLL